MFRRKRTSREPCSVHYIARYTERSVTNSIGRRGPLPLHLDRDDVVQDVHLRLVRALGRRYDQRISRARSTGWEASEEHAALKKAVSQAIDTARGTADKRRQ